MVMFNLMPPLYFSGCACDTRDETDVLSSGAPEGLSYLLTATVAIIHCTALVGTLAFCLVTPPLSHSLTLFTARTHKQLGLRAPLIPGCISDRREG